jgi:hypothetical protein
LAEEGLLLSAGGDLPLVFLNYRSEGESSLATLLDEMLSAELGRDVVFLDYRSITLGQDFVPALLNAVRRAAVLLVIIGRDWLRTDESGRRLVDDPDDWVRREIVEALSANVLVVPVLVGDRPQLVADELPDDLKIVARLQYARIRHRHQPQDIRNLITLLVTQSPRLAHRAESLVNDPPAPVGGGRRRVLLLGVATVLVVVLEWFVVASTHRGVAQPPETGDPVSLVGVPTATGGLEYARPTPLTSGPEHDELVDTSDPTYHPLTGDDYVSVRSLSISFQVKGNRRTPVQITNIAPEITGTAAVLSGTLVRFPSPGGERPAISLVANLDDPRRIVRAPDELDTPWFTRHHVELAKDENQQFEVNFTGNLAAYAFRVVVDYVAGDGAPGRLVVADEDGKPFQLTGKPADGRYGAVYVPNFPRSGGWHLCGGWPEDRCPG